MNRRMHPLSANPLIAAVCYVGDAVADAKRLAFLKWVFPFPHAKKTRQFAKVNRVGGRFNHHLCLRNERAITKPGR